MERFNSLLTRDPFLCLSGVGRRGISPATVLLRHCWLDRRSCLTADPTTMLLTLSLAPPHGNKTPKKHSPFFAYTFLASALLLLHCFALYDTPSAFITRCLTSFYLCLDSESASTPSLMTAVENRGLSADDNAAALSLASPRGLLSIWMKEGCWMC